MSFKIDAVNKSYWDGVYWLCSTFGWSLGYTDELSKTEVDHLIEAHNRKIKATERAQKRAAKKNQRRRR